MGNSLELGWGYCSVNHKWWAVNIPKYQLYEG